MSTATSTSWFAAALFFVLSLHRGVSIAYPAALQLHQTINSTSSSWNTTNEVPPYCRYERDWYDPPGNGLDITDCMDAIQLLIDEDVANYGARPFGWSYPKWSSVDTPLTRANPRHYISGNCVLSIWMRSLGKEVDEEIWNADPRGSGGLVNDNADFQSLARRAYKIFDECVLASGKSQTARGTAGWLPSGAGNSMVVSLWGREGVLDSWLDGKGIEAHLQLPVASESSVSTT